MKITLLFLSLLLTLSLSCAKKSDFSIDVPAGSVSTPSPSYVTWLVQLGAVTKGYLGADNSQYDGCSSTAVDSSGNVYCAGYTDGAIGETNGGGHDAFVMKLNSSGVIQWVTQLGNDTEASSAQVNDTAGDDVCNNVAVDGSGNVYCAGQTNGALGETNGGGNDAYVMKLNSSGVVQWLTHLGSVTEASSAQVNDTAGGDFCNGVAVDSSGNVYCAGYTNGALGETNGGGHDAFVMKLNSAGVVQWVSQLGSVTEASSAQVNNTAGNDYCNKVALDGSGEVYCSGATYGALAEVNGGGQDAFVMKLNSAGVVQWVTQLGSATEASSAQVNNTAGNDSCESVAVDSSSNVYCAGETNGALGETNGGGNDAYVMKLNSSGVVQWVSQLGSVTEASSAQVNNTSGSDYCYSVTVDSSGNVYCGGNTGSVLAEAAGTWVWDPFALKLNSSGVVQWVSQLGSVTLPDPAYLGGSAYGIAVDGNGYVYIAGEIYGTASEAEGGGGNGDVFVTKMRPDGTFDL